MRACGVKNNMVNDREEQNEGIQIADPTCGTKAKICMKIKIYIAVA